LILRPVFRKPRVERVDKGATKQTARVRERVIRSVAEQAQGCFASVRSVQMAFFMRSFLKIPAFVNPSLSALCKARTTSLDFFERKSLQKRRWGV
jgi:hypothetical protein